MRPSRYSEFERFYSSAVRLAASAFIQDSLTLDVVANAPALTHQGIVIARDRLRSIVRKGPLRRPTEVSTEDARPAAG